RLCAGIGSKLIKFPPASSNEKRFAMRNDEVAKTFVCHHCGKRVQRGRYQNRFQRSNTRINDRGRYCSDRCRKAASRARLKARAAPFSRSVTWLPGTKVRRSGTPPNHPTKNTTKFLTKKTAGGRCPPAVPRERLWLMDEARAIGCGVRLVTVE